MESTISTTKRCTKCGNVKPLSEYKLVKKRGTYMASCKACNYLAHSAWLRNNPEKAKEYGRRARGRSKDKQALRRLKWIRLNPERHAQSQRESRIKIYRENLAKEKEKRRIETNELSNRYIAKIMRLPIRLLPRELIDAKRAQILIYRHLKESK